MGPNYLMGRHGRGAGAPGEPLDGHEQQHQHRATEMFALHSQGAGIDSANCSVPVVIMRKRALASRQTALPVAKCLACCPLLMLIVVAGGLLVATSISGADAATGVQSGPGLVGRQNSRTLGAQQRPIRHELELELEPLPSPEPLAGGPANGAGDRPRLIPLVAAESGYSENSSVNILCTVSQGHHESLQFEWFKDGQPIGSDGEAGPGQPFESSYNIQQHRQHPHGQLLPQIEKHSDHSLLRIARVQSHHSGRYTCAAKSQFGQDSSSVNLMVNVKLQWIKEPAREIVVSLNQELKVDCLAQGEPKPQMRWEKLDSISNPFAQQHSSGSSAPNTKPAPTMPLMYSIGAPKRPDTGLGQHQSTMQFPAPNGAGYPDGGATKNQLVAKAEPTGLGYIKQPAGAGGLSQASGNQLISSSRYLSIQRARETDSGFYECIASNSHDNDLRKLVHVQVRGPPKILPIATADSYPEGSSINLICTVSGGQRRGLTLKWTINGDEMDESKLKYPNEKFENVAINTDDADISILKIKNATLKNSGRYTCTARNPLGEDSTSVEIVINVEMKWNKFPKDLVEIGLNQELRLECDATGSPKPTIEWIKHSESPDKRANGTNFISKDKLMKINRVQHKDSGLYECIARNGVDDQLRKIIQVKVRGK